MCTNCSSAGLNITSPKTLMHTLDLFHHHSQWPEDAPHLCPDKCPDPPGGQWVPCSSLPEDYLMAYNESGPITKKIEADNKGAGNVTTSTTTTASTTVKTAVHYEPLSGQVYFLINGQSGKALSLSAADHRTIVASPHRGLDEQWRVEKQRGSGGAWLLRCIGSGKFLDFEGDPRRGARLLGSRVPRNWKLTLVDEDTCAYHLYVPKSQLNAEVSDDEVLPGAPAPVTLEKSSPLPSQLWRFEPTSLVVTEAGDEIISTSITTTVTKVKIVTKVKKS